MRRAGPVRTRVGQLLAATVIASLIGSGCGSSGEQAGDSAAESPAVEATDPTPAPPPPTAAPPTPAITEPTSTPVPPTPRPEREPIIVELTVEPFDVIGLTPGRFSTDNDEILIDAGQATTIVLDGNSPVWFGLLDGYPTFFDLPTAAPELMERARSGLSSLAACPEAVVVVSTTEPDELVAYDLQTGEVRWRVPGDRPQIACGDASTLVVQTDFDLSGLDLADGSVRWSVPLQPDDPLRTTSAQAIVGTYDDLRALDLETGELVWSRGDSSSSVRSLGAGFLIAELDNPDGFDLITASGEIVGTVPRELITDADWRAIRTADGLVTTIEAPDLGGDRTPGAVSTLFGEASDGLWWAGVVNETAEVTVGLVDADLTVIATSGAILPEGRAPEILTLAGVFVLFDTGEAVIADRSS